MTKKEALEGSIKKWKRIVRSTKEIDAATDNCPLCQKYYDGPGSRCWQCPVKELTGVWGCSDTPYVEWSKHQEDDHGRDVDCHREPYCKECLRLAKEELAFLESLR